MKKSKFYIVMIMIFSVVCLILVCVLCGLVAGLGS